MRSSPLIFCTLFFAFLSAAGPLKRDGQGKHVAGQMLVARDNNDPDFISIIPITATSSTTQEPSESSTVPSTGHGGKPGSTNLDSTSGSATTESKSTSTANSPTTTSNNPSLSSSTLITSNSRPAQESPTSTSDSTTLGSTKSSAIPTSTSEVLSSPSSSNVSTAVSSFSSTESTLSRNTTALAGSSPTVRTFSSAQPLHTISIHTSTHSLNSTSLVISPISGSLSSSISSTLATRSVTATTENETPVTSLTSSTSSNPPAQEFTAINTLTGFSEISPKPKPNSMSSTTVTTAAVTSASDGSISTTLSTTPSAQIPRPDSATISISTTPLPNSVTRSMESETLTSSISRFTLTNSNTIPLPSSTPETTPQFTLSDTNAIPLPTSETSSNLSTSTLIIDVSTLTSSKAKQTLPSNTLITPPITMSQIPTILPSSMATSTSLTPAQYSSNLAQAQGYNALFSGLNFSSPCTSGEIACISGNVGICNNQGSFVMSICSGDDECFAIPMNHTRGVYVGCTDKVAAANILAGDSASGGQASATSIVNPKSGANTPATSASTTTGIGSLTLSTSVTPLPSTADSLPPHPTEPIPSGVQTVTTTQHPPPNITTVTRSATKTNSNEVPAQTPPPSQITTPAKGSESNMISIVPITMSTPLKETVTVTVTKTERIP